MSYTIKCRIHFGAEVHPKISGKQTISGLVLRGAKVYMGARSAEKAEAAIADIRKLVPKAEIHFLKMDLARLSSVVEAAKEFLQ